MNRGSFCGSGRDSPGCDAPIGSVPDVARRLADGSYEVEARYVLKLDDGTLVMVHNAGRMVPQGDGSFRGRTRAELEVPAGPSKAWARWCCSAPHMPPPGTRKTSSSSSGTPRSEAQADRIDAAPRFVRAGAPARREACLCDSFPEKTRRHDPDGLVFIDIDVDGQTR